MRHTREGSSVREKLRRLEKLNKKLGQVFQASQGNALLQAHRKRSIEWLPSISFDHASSIHRAITRSYQCSCIGPHVTKLQLPPLRVKEEPVLNSPKAVSSLLFSVDDPAIASASSDMLPQLTDVPSSSKLDSGQAMAVRAGGSDVVDRSLSLQSGRQSNSDMSQSFSDLSLVATNISTNTTVFTSSNSRTHSADVVETSRPDAPQIVDLCTSLRSLGLDKGGSTDDKSLGILPLADSKSYELILTSQLTPANSSMLSLEDLFTSAPNRLARGFRIELAVQMATAILQLCMTPWLPTAWSWKEFSMTGFPGDDLTPSALYIAHQFQTQSKADSQRQKMDPRKQISMAVTPGEPVLTRLGFALVELAFGQRLSAMAGSASNAQAFDPYYQDLAIAGALVQSGQLLHEEGRRYHEAVMNCLKQEIRMDGHGWKTLRLHDPSFHTDAADSILRPLVDLWMAEVS